MFGVVDIGNLFANSALHPPVEGASAVPNNQTSETLNLITVRETATSEIHPSGARISVRIAGNSFFTGREALTKAVEVVTLVSILKESGITDDQIQLANVSTDVERGIPSQLPTATYQLIVECPSVELLGRVVAAICSQAHSRIAGISWQYINLPTIKRDLIHQAVCAAKEAAKQLAESLSGSLAGVHKVSYEIVGPETGFRNTDSSAYARRAGKKATSAYFSSLTVTQASTIAATVTADFIVELRATGT